MKMLNLKKLKGFLLSGLMLGAAYAVTSILGAHDAMAQTTGTDLANSMDQLTQQIDGAARVVYTASYIGGTVALMMGAFKLKAHAENPSQTPMQQGLSRLAVGAGLIALPSAGEMLTKSLGFNTEQSLHSEKDKFDIEDGTNQTP